MKGSFSMSGFAGTSDRKACMLAHAKHNDDLVAGPRRWVEEAFAHYFMAKKHAGDCVALLTRNRSRLGPIPFSRRGGVL